MDEPLRVPQPDDGDERAVALGWLAFHRSALEAKCSGLTNDHLVARSAAPSHLSLLGLVRHMAEMEHAYGSWPHTEVREFAWIWGTYEDGAEDDIDCAPDDVSVSLQAWHRERDATDQGLSSCADLGMKSVTNGRSIRWNLAKLVGEYARHNGHADIIRERIDGETGE